MGGRLIIYGSSVMKQQPTWARLRNFIRRYGEGREDNNGNGHLKKEVERAKSTAEEFEKIAEEKTRQGFASPKPQDGAEESTMGESGAEESTMGESALESVKEKYKETVGKGNFRNK